MPLTEDDIKARLLAEAEVAIEKMLAKRQRQAALTLTEIEQLALDLRQEVGEKATQVLADAGEVVNVPGPKCPACGTEMHSKGRKRRRVVTRSGEIELERTYYYCERCKQGFFPPG
jgi:tRNA(Ile2) C34 agmatinyltransferase TiaS